MTEVDMEVEDRRRPIGASVEPRVVRRPDRTVIEGRCVRLEPLDAAGHAPALWRNADDPLFWTIVDRASGDAQG